MRHTTIRWKSDRICAVMALTILWIVICFSSPPFYLDYTLRQCSPLRWHFGTEQGFRTFSFMIKGTEGQDGRYGGGWKSRTVTGHNRDFILSCDVCPLLSAMYFWRFTSQYWRHECGKFMATSPLHSHLQTRITSIAEGLAKSLQLRTPNRHSKLSIEWSLVYVFMIPHAWCICASSSPNNIFTLSHITWLHYFAPPSQTLLNIVALALHFGVWKRYASSFQW